VIDYDPHHWRSHFFDLEGSMVREIAYRVGVCALVAIGVSVATHFQYDISISEKPHQLIAPALALLLVFRTNSANDRYLEGRRLWGGIVNSSRNLRRKSMQLLGPEVTAQIVEWTIAFAWATRNHLNNTKVLGEGLQLTAEQQQTILAASHPPTAAAATISRLLVAQREAGKLTDIQHQMLDADVQALIDHLGGCERIKSTPLPFAYAVHLRRALVVYCGTLPFALVGTFQHWTALVTILVAYILIGIEEIGTEVESPFGVRHNDLPLDRICTNLSAQLRDASNA
jgi:putative membrane protein